MPEATADLDRLLKDLSVALLDGVTDAAERELLLRSYRERLAGSYGAAFTAFAGNYPQLLAWVRRMEEPYLVIPARERVGLVRYGLLRARLRGCRTAALNLAVLRYNTRQAPPDLERQEVQIHDVLSQLAREVARDPNEQARVKAVCADIRSDLDYAAGRSTYASAELREAIGHRLQDPADLQ